MQTQVSTTIKAHAACRIDDLTEQIFLLTEGAIVTARITGSSTSARTARAAALKLLDSHDGEAI